MVNIWESYGQYYSGLFFLNHSVDAAYCYRLSSVVYRSISHSGDPCKKAEAIEMPFGLWTQGTMYY